MTDFTSLWAVRLENVFSYTIVVELTSTIKSLQSILPCLCPWLDLASQPWDSHSTDTHLELLFFSFAALPHPWFTHGALYETNDILIIHLLNCILSFVGSLKIEFHSPGLNEEILVKRLCRTIENRFKVT